MIYFPLLDIPSRFRLGVRLFASGGHVPSPYPSWHWLCSFFYFPPFTRGLRRRFAVPLAMQTLHPTLRTFNNLLVFILPRSSRTISVSVNQKRLPLFTLLHTCLGLGIISVSPPSWYEGKNLGCFPSLPRGTELFLIAISCLYPSCVMLGWRGRMFIFVTSCPCPRCTLLGERKRLFSFIFSRLCPGCAMVGEIKRLFSSIVSCPCPSCLMVGSRKGGD